MLLERANADIILAQYAILPEGNPSNDEYMIDMAAYHVFGGRIHGIVGAARPVGG